MKQSSKKPTGSVLVLAVILVMAVSAGLEENAVEEPFYSSHPDCSNGLDDDNDGLVDYDDPECTNENNAFGESVQP